MGHPLFSFEHLRILKGINNADPLPYHRGGVFLFFRGVPGV